jgi:hypothetical protein
MIPTLERTYTPSKGRCPSFLDTMMAPAGKIGCNLRKFLTKVWLFVKLAENGPGSFSLGKGRQIGQGHAMSQDDDFEFLIPESRSKLLMVDEKERKLLRLVLAKTLGSESGKRYVIERLGREYVEIGEALLHQMEEEEDKEA